MTTENQDPNLNQEGSIPIRTKAIQTPYDYYKLLQDTEKRGKTMYGEKYTIQDIDRPVVLKLLCYFLQDKNIAESEGIDLTKGVMLTGKVGCGKTTLMKIMRSFIPETNKPGMGSCRDISFEFSQAGYEVIYKYSKNAFYPYSVVPRAYCFDDLGVETTGHYFGQDCNVMAEILLSRYDLFISHKMITHVTTNLNSTELEKAYGNRVRSRMREMFNLIAFNTETTDKR